MKNVTEPWRYTEHTVGKITVNKTAKTTLKKKNTK